MTAAGKGELPDTLYVFSYGPATNRHHKIYTRLATAKGARTNYLNQHKRSLGLTEAYVYEIRVGSEAWEQIVPLPLDPKDKSVYTVERDSKRKI